MPKRISKSAILAGTGFEGRERTIRAHCREGIPVTLRREPSNVHDPNAIAVYISVARLGGLLGTTLKQIGFIKAQTASSLADVMDRGTPVTATVKSFWAPEDREYPRVTLVISYEI